MIRALIAWLCFIAALIFMGFDVIDFTITGLFILGVVLLVVWARLLGIFTTAFWLIDGPERHPDELHHGHTYGPAPLTHDEERA